MGQTDGKGVHLHPNSLGTRVHLQPRTILPQERKALSYKELGHGSSSNHHRQRQVDMPYEAMQANNFKLCIGTLKEGKKGECRESR